MTSVRISLLEQSVNNLEKRMERVENKLETLREDLLKSHAALTKNVIGAVVTIIVTCLTTIGAFLSL